MIVSYSKSSAWLTVFATVATISLSFAQPLDVIWDRSGNDPDSHFGEFLFPLGDQNDDGFADWGVWSQAGNVGAESESMAQLFHGGNPPPNEPYLTILAPRDAFELTYSTSVGDVNGDGFTDWFTGVLYQNGTRYFHSVFWGGPDYDEIADFHFTFDGYTIINTRESFNFNGDEYDDIYVYSFNEDRGKVLYGGAAMDTIPDWELTTPDGVIQQALPSTFGDLNGDRFDDFVSHDANIGQIWVFTGGISPDMMPARTLYGYSSLRRTVIGDLNNDGFDDLIILQDSGVLTVHLGSEELLLEPSFEVDIPGEVALPRFHSAGDFNADGYSDLMTTDYSCNQGWGVFNLFMGTRWHEVQHAFTLAGRSEAPFLVGITWACGPGDINGDGIDDIIIGATNNDADGRRGRAVAMAGSTDYQVPVNNFPPIAPVEFDVSVYPNPFNAQTTIEFDIPPGSSRIDIQVFNTLGRIVHKENLPAIGTKMRYFFNAADLSSGTYFLNVNTAISQVTEKLVLVK